ncbi:hypothetical protein DVK44_03860 [Streptomyces paludis]|uniref:Uncharacterized protein n=2 Tax=Streptomyces paludis TaxID=2282738 RepID=A0A345HJT5_9ACTN|nr:hypothetical protein DVK44_03860 [Streptomyces paludis]
MGRKSKDALVAVDRLLGGLEPPTRFQRLVARHPVAVGFAVAVPLILVSLVTVRPGDGIADALFFVGSSAALGAVFGGTAYAERLRQRRLVAQGLYTFPLRPGSGSGLRRRGRS